MKRKKCIILLLVLMLAQGVTSCKANDKGIVLSNDVKKDLMSQDKDSIKVEKLKEFPMDNSQYDPLYWKDDENFIAINDIGNATTSHNIYNININTSLVTKIDSLDNALIVGGLNQNYDGVSTKSSRLIFIRDFKLWLYNISDGTSKIIYDLADVKNEIEEKYSNWTVERNYDESGQVTGVTASSDGSASVTSGSSTKNHVDKTPFKVEYPTDFNIGLNVGFVKGSDRYVFIKGPKSLRILDLQSGQVVITEGSTFGIDEIDNTVLYSKMEDAFYVYALYNHNTAQKEETLYEIKLNNPDEFKTMAKIPGYGYGVTSISDNGKDIYFSSSNVRDGGVSNNSIIMFDTTKNTFAKLFVDWSDAKYSFTYNYRSNLLFYEYWAQDANTRDNPMCFMGSLNNVKLKVAQNITPGRIDNMNTNFIDIVYNQKGDKFIFRVHYFEKGTKVIKGINYVYGVER